LVEANCCVGPDQVTIVEGLDILQDELGMASGLPHFGNPAVDVYPPSLLPIFIYCRKPQVIWVFLGAFSEAPQPSNFAARRDWLIPEFF
jgi:hypothetical protein